MSLLSKKKESKSALNKPSSSKGLRKPLFEKDELPQRVSKSAKPLSTDNKKSGKMPSSETLQPMLATLVEVPIDEPGWTYEIKWDGYRALAFCK